MSGVLAKFNSIPFSSISPFKIQIRSDTTPSRFPPSPVHRADPISLSRSLARASTASLAMTRLSPFLYIDVLNAIDAGLQMGRGGRAGTKCKRRRNGRITDSENSDEDYIIEEDEDEQLDEL
ncbi:hypothetical protein AKJ16_DCAP15402, partial [Drosera capensis]